MQQPESLDKIISDLGRAYQPQVDVLNQQKAGLGARFDSQRSALDAMKVQGFNNINNQASSSGQAFTGFRPEEQANYLSTQYLPGIQALDQQKNDQSLELDKTLASIHSDKVLKATDLRGQQQRAYESYLEAERQRAFQAEQNRLERAAAAALAAAARQQAQPTAADLINAWGDQMYAAQGDKYRKNYAWENSSIKGQLLQMGISGQDSYKLRKQLLGY